MVGPTLSIERPNGSFEFVAAANESAFQSDVGTFEVRGQNLTETVGFVALDFPVRFTDRPTDRFELVGDPR